jgi:hypothetical protein
MLQWWLSLSLGNISGFIILDNSTSRSALILCRNVAGFRRGKSRIQTAIVLVIVFAETGKKSQSLTQLIYNKQVALEFL